MLFDAAVALFLLAAAAAGAWKGFALQAAGAGSIAAGFLLGPPLSRLLAPQLGLPAPLDRRAAFALLYVAISLLVFLAALGVRRALERAGLRAWDRHLGALSGACSGLLLLIVLSGAALAWRADWGDGLRATRAGQAMGAAVEGLREVLPGSARRVLDPFLEPLRPRPPGAAAAELRPPSRPCTGLTVRPRSCTARAGSRIL